MSRPTGMTEQVGIHDVKLLAGDELGNEVEQFFDIEVVEQSVAPRISSRAVRSAVLGGLYLYDVNAADFGTRESLTYSLDSAPPGMVIDALTGVIQWIARPGLGSEPVTVRVTDSTGLVDTQSFVLEVQPDTTAPVLTLTATPARVTPGQDVVVELGALDDVEVVSAEVTVDGVAVALDAQGQAVISNPSPGVHRVVASASDPSGNVATTTVVFGVQDATDVAPPSITLSSPVQDQALSYVHTLQGQVSDDNLQSYRIELVREGTGERRVIEQRMEPPSPGVLVETFAVGMAGALGVDPNDVGLTTELHDALAAVWAERSPARDRARVAGCERG